MRRLKFVSEFAALTLLMPATALASLPDTTFIDYDIIYDTKEKFKASGTLTNIDRSVPPNSCLAADIPEIDGQYWMFSFFNTHRNWRIPPGVVDNGSNETSVWLDGMHKDGPHVIDVDPNNLNLIQSIEANVAFSAIAHVKLTAASWVEHETTSGGPHYDAYSIEHNVTAMEGPDHQFTGPFEIKARHTAAKAETVITHDMVMGSSSGSGAYISYDAGLASLTIHMGPFDILNSTGSLAPGIEAAFLDDPILNAGFGDVILTFLGVLPGGGYRFSGGTSFLLDPEGDLAVKASFAEYLIHDTSRIGTYNSFAMHDSMTVVDQGDCASPFLDAFAGLNLMGRGIPDEVWFEIQGTCLVFVTPQDLSVLTGGFTASAFNIPATVAISSARGVASVSGVVQKEHIPAPSRSYPNPFQSRATIEYRVDRRGPVRIDIFDLKGRVVRRLVEEPEQTAGQHVVEWDGTTDDSRAARSGIYFYRITQGGRSFTGDLILIR